MAWPQSKIHDNFLNNTDKHSLHIEETAPHTTFTNTGLDYHKFLTKKTYKKLP